MGVGPDPGVNCEEVIASVKVHCVDIQVRAGGCNRVESWFEEFDVVAVGPPCR